MITGVVTERREAVIRVKVLSPAGQDRDIEAVIDTGFDGWLSLPAHRRPFKNNVGVSQERSG